MKKKIGISMLILFGVVVCTTMIINMGWAGVAILGTLAYLFVATYLIK